MKKGKIGQFASFMKLALGNAMGPFVIGGNELVKYRGRSETVVIPEEAKGIDGGAFYLNRHVKTVVIPKHVTRIDDLAFMSAESIESFIVADENPMYCSVNGALLTKDGTRLLKVPVTVTEYVVPETVRELGLSAFDECVHMKRLTLPKGITRLENRALFGCCGLEELIIPEGVVSVGQHAFGQCTSLKRVVLPSTLEDLDPQAFYSATELTEITVHENNPHFMSIDGALLSKDGTCLKAVPAGITRYEIPKHVTVIGEYAFFCGNLETVTVPVGVQKIMNNAFHSCVHLKKAELPDGVEFIGKEAFNACYSLQDLQLPDSVMVMGNNALYRSGIRELRIPAGLRVISKRMCEHCSNLKTVTIPGHIERIDDFAFSRCAQLERVVIEEGVKFIGDYAFSDCKHLHEANIPRSVIGFGEQVFLDCFFAKISLYPDSCAAQRLYDEGEHILYLGDSEGK